MTITTMENKMFLTTSDNGKSAHIPVMLEAVLEGLNVRPEGIYVDATFGRGGHARAILDKLNQNGHLLVLDRDPEAIAEANALAIKDKRLTVKQGSFKNLYTGCEAEDLIGKVDGILFDLGVSSPQLDSAHRGFSFKNDGPLDMRMDPSAGISAADWLSSAPEADISSVLKTFGEERFHRRIAGAIVAARNAAPITTTRQLAEIVAKAHPAWEKIKHPATRSFQAIRIFINNELEEIGLGLDQALEILANSGRLAVISFHSLEDRLVKRFIQKHEKGDEHPIGLPILANQMNQRLRRLGRSIKPTEGEIAKNKRARSAILRLAEKRCNSQ
jgi:16S rRNA (cytosine1402-N4)-methyltransferase